MRIFSKLISALLAQRIEHEPSKLGVEGSNPSERATQSASPGGASHNSGERGPSVMPDAGGADTFLRSAIKKAIRDLDLAAFGEGPTFNMRFIKRDLEQALASFPNGERSDG